VDITRAEANGMELWELEGSLEEAREEWQARQAEDEGGDGNDGGLPDAA
jgi:hypothetical protein